MKRRKNTTLNNCGRIFVKADVGHMVKVKLTRTTLRSHPGSVSRQQPFKEHFFLVLPFHALRDFMLPTPTLNSWFELIRLQHAWSHSLAQRLS